MRKEVIKAGLTIMANGLIYAIDDEESIRKLYEESLSFGGFEVKTGQGKNDLEVLLAAKRPDLILLDVMLEGDDGFTLLTNIRANPETHDIPVIMVSAKGNEIDKVTGLNLGADDYIAKPFGVHELLARIRANLRKKDRLPGTVYKDLKIDETKYRAYLNNVPIKLTKTEFALLTYLVKHQNEVVSKKELLVSVWGLEENSETRTVDIHVLNLRRRLAPSEVDITTVWGVGYMLK